MSSNLFIAKTRQDAKITSMLNQFFEKNERITQKDLAKMLSSLPTVGKKQTRKTSVLRKRSSTNKRRKHSSSSNKMHVSSPKKRSSSKTSSNKMDVVF
jgi:exopolysaccharide biosynthesis predicted pyruvyltransferase EpsI